MKMIFILEEVIKNMSRNETYKTRQKELILDVIKNFKNDFTIKEIYEKLNQNVGLTTIYRTISKLVEEGKIKKSIDYNNVVHYQYLDECQCDNHFYLKCDKCGSITHVDCDCINDFTNHVLKNHSFKVDNVNIIIKGICKKCSK